MQDVQELVALARSLGEAMARHPHVTVFHAARQAVLKDNAAQQLLQEHQQKLQRLQELEEAGQPIEVADKQTLKEVELRMASNESLKQLLRAQADYVDLMNRVNQAMEAPLSAAANPGAPA